MLRQDGPRAELLAALEGGERLILLGDVLELRHGPVREALGAAEPLLRALGSALGSAGEVVIVPGNHDHGLLAPWLGRRALAAETLPLGLETAVDWREGEPLGRMAAWLGPARVRAAYPGVWLRADVYATHGHYGDRHTTVPMFERLGAGAMARIVGRADGAMTSVDDYEAVLAPMYAWIQALAERGGRAGQSSHAPSTRVWRVLNRRGRRARLRRLALKAAVPVAVGALDRVGLGPLGADLSGPELRRAGLRGLAEVVARLRVPAAHVIFGHTHRAGPLPGDDPLEWVTESGAQLLNTGCWVHEAAFLGPAPATSPYRAGFAARVGDSGPPELVNLLD